MKVKDVLKQASEEIVKEEAELVKEIVKLRVREIKSAQKTLKKLENEHAKFLETDFDDLDLEEYDY